MPFMSVVDYVFDLDGTISDPKVGMAKSINFALTSHDFDSVDEEMIGSLIGLPLDQMYKQFCGVEDKSLLDALVAKYRAHFWEIGYSENTIYPDIDSSLRYLHSQPGARLGICTSKPSDIAEKILKMFDLDLLFNFISGGDVGIEKHQQLQRLLKDGVIGSSAMMIGDRFVDVRAAQHNNLRSVAVLWGYGSRSELENEQPNFLLENPTEIVGLAVGS